MHLFKNSFAEKPEGILDIPELVDKLQEGFWKKDILNLRSKSGELSYKKLKSSLPAITVSAELKSRDKTIPVEKRLKKHTGLICLDIDKKDNPKMRAKDIIDPECLLEYVSCSGEGKKIIYRCATTLDSNEHRRIYDAAVLRLRDMGVNIKVDPIVKSIASLQYVSYDPYLHYNAKSKVFIKPLPKPKKQIEPPAKDKEQVISQIQDYIKALGKKDCTAKYEDWLSVGFGLAHTLQEAGRGLFHLLSRNHSAYAKAETDEKYDSLLDRNIESLEKPRTIASVFSIINECLSPAVRKQLAKKYAHSHAVAKAVDSPKKNSSKRSLEVVPEENSSTDLEGMVRFKLFLFKKVIDKESKQVTDLIPHALNFNAFEALLKAKGFYRYEKMFVRVVENIVDKCDADDVLRVITEHIEEEGDYHFTYKQTEFIISWEEIIHLWRKSRGNSTIYNQLRSSLLRWEPNLLKDTAEVSFVPYKNGVIQVTKKGITLVEYAELKQQIWRERILPREYKHKATKTGKHKPGMFEVFFANVCGRGVTYKQRVESEPYKRAMWYYGYMLQGFKRQSVARAWLLYDIISGNNGRSGKTILGQAVGKIRSVVTIDGKTLDITQRFAFQTVQPWTDVVFIDDPKKGMSLIPMFNMISGDFQADKKNEQPLVKPVKVMIASNWILEAEGTSEAGRQFVTQLDDYYIRYSKEHNTIAPIVKAHGKEFFTGWDAKDWEQFDNFSLRCLQYHLLTEIPANTVVGNALLLRFIQSNEEEMFFELASIFSEHAKLGRDNKLMIVMAMLTTAITEHSRHMKSLQAAGYVARGFLKCIGGGEIQITSMDVAGFKKQAYRLSCGWEGIDFGNYNDRIKRGAKGK